jgi:serine/alanine adding enzyme
VTASPLQASVLAAEPAMRVTVRDDVPSRDTAQYVEARADATPYHLPEWSALIGTTFGHHTCYLAADTPSGIAGVLPLVNFRSRVFGRFTVSLPFVNYGGVLADNPAVEQALVERAIAETTRLGGSHLELRHRRQHFADLSPRRHKVAMELTLQPTADAQWSALDRKIRNQVRKAQKSGLEACSGGAELLPQFYAVFARNMRDLGTPVYTAALFNAVLARFADRSRVFVIRSNGQPVAAGIVHWHGQRLEVPWASSLREFNPLCANVLLYWAIVSFAVERRFTVLDFGRSSPNAGTFHFKKQWGAEPRELVWEYWTSPGHPVPQLSPDNPKFSLAIQAWQRLPVRVATAIGPLIVRNIP